jgi:glycosyltransferase involved in cell wall biosynthesis
VVLWFCGSVVLWFCGSVVLGLTHMRIGYDTTSIDAQPSGVGTFTRLLFDALRLAGRMHQFVALSNRPGAATQSFPSRMAWMQCMLPSEITRLGINICHYTNSIAPLYHTTPYVVTIYDMTLNLLPRQHPFRKQLIVRPIVALAARRAQRVITISEQARADIARLLHIPYANILVTPAAVDPMIQHMDLPEQQRVRNKYRINRPFVLFVGTIEPRKNLARLVAAWAQLRKNSRIVHQLVLVGGHGWHDAPIFQQIASSGFAEDIRLTGYVPREDLAGLYSAADAFAFPSLAEGFGLPVIEAFACGTPTLISDTPALIETAAGAAMTCDPYSIAAIARGLEQILTDQALRYRLHELGILRAQHFSWHRTAELTIEVYQQALGMPYPTNDSHITPQHQP